MLLTLQNVFGTNATQNATTVSFLKSDLLGLTVVANNDASSLLAAIVNTAHQNYEGNLTDQNGNSITDQNGNSITYDNRYYYTGTWLIFWGYLLPSGKLNSVFLASVLTPYTPS